MNFNMTFNKDIYEYIAIFVNCKTLINMFLTNKQFLKDEFFIRVMNKRYPELIKQKDRKEDTKNFYLENFQYLIKLDEIDFPYIPTRFFSPKTAMFYKEKLWNYGLINAILAKRKDLIHYMLEKGANNFENAIINASIIGDFQTLLFFFGKETVKKETIEKALGIAAAQGNMEIINYLISKGGEDFKNALEWAARNNHLEIVEFFQNKGVTDFERAKELAIIGGNFEIFKKLDQK